jgi:DNA-binding response OmpR family regulator
MPKPNAHWEGLPVILVVDDDPTILTFLRLVLPQEGFAVLTASNGADAIDVFRRARYWIAAVLLDVRMPGLDGPQTLTALREIDPQVPCCFMSGDTGEYSAQELCNQSGSSVIGKPFQLPELVSVLRRLSP